MNSLRLAHATTRILRTASLSRATFSSTPHIMTSYKLKGISALGDLKSGEMKEVEVEGIDGGKVLLCKANDTVTAIGNKCTHYGAPLAKGVLTKDGRVTCPWHGACFNTTSGDIEHAPALDNLPAFKLSEEGGAVYIEGDKETITSSRRKPSLVIKGGLKEAAADSSIIVVGAGSGGLATVEALREDGYTGAIKLIGSEGYTPIDRTKLSKALIEDHSKIALRDEAWFKSSSIDFINDEVTKIDFSSNKVVTRSGKSHSYKKLVLATGGTPRNLPLPGFKDLDNIFPLRTIPHVKAINKAIGEKGKKIVIIGSSFIGMEVANAVAKGNDVTVVGMEKAPLERVMGEEVGKIFQRSLEANGVKFMMNAGVEKASPSKINSSTVGSIELKDGTSLPADVVVLGVGVAPTTNYLKDNKVVSFEKDGSLTVDANFSVSGVKDVYAIGDIATFPYHGPGGDGKPVRIEHWNVAQNAGRISGKHINSPQTKSVPFIPVFWSALGAQLRYCGNTVNGFDDVVITGQPAEAKFVAYYTKGETVVAVASMGKDPVMAQASELMRQGRMPTKSQIQKNEDIVGTLTF